MFFGCVLKWWCNYIYCFGVIMMYFLIILFIYVVVVLVLFSGGEYFGGSIINWYFLLFGLWCGMKGIRYVLDICVSIQVLVVVVVCLMVNNGMKMFECGL